MKHKIIYRDKNNISFLILEYEEVKPFLNELSEQKRIEKKINNEIYIYGENIKRVDLFNDYIFGNKIKLDKSFTLIKHSKSDKYVFVPIIDISEESSYLKYYFEESDLEIDKNNHIILNWSKDNILRFHNENPVLIDLTYIYFTECISYNDKLIIVSNVSEYINAIYYFRLVNTLDYLNIQIKSFIKQAQIEDDKKASIFSEIDSLVLDIDLNKLSFTKYKNELNKIISCLKRIRFIAGLNRFDNNTYSYCNYLIDYAENSRYFYRGVGVCGYKELPSVLRGKQNESQMFYDFLLKFPNELEKMSVINQLTEMQHFGLPTRLLDITENPLVALYMACTSLFNSGKANKEYGEVIIYPVREQIKILDSAEVLLNASLAILSNDEKEILLNNKDFGAVNNLKQLMIGFISRHMNFPDDFNVDILKKSYFVEVGNTNPRITAQSGAFILFGLDTNYINTIPSSRNSNIRILIKDKNIIYEELKSYNINDASMFPDKDHAARYIKDKFCK